MNDRMNSRLDIYVPPFAPTPAVRLEVNGSNACWLNMTPEQAFDTASALWKAAAAALMGKGTRPSITMTADGKVPIVPGRQLNEGFFPNRNVMSPYTQPVIAISPDRKRKRSPKRKNQEIKPDQENQDVQSSDEDAI